MKTNIKLLTVLFVLTLFACKKTKEDDPYNYTVSSMPAVSDAKLLLILNDDILNNTNNAQLVKITTADQVQPFAINDNNGKDVSDKFKPYKLSNAHPDFMMLTVNNRGQGIANKGYLLKKADGSLISVDDNGVPIATDLPGYSVLNNPFTYYDGSSYIYTIAGDNTTTARLIRISTANPNLITTTVVTSDTVRAIYGFEVDADNNILADLSVKNGNNRYLLAFNTTNATKIGTVGNDSYWKNGNGVFGYLSSTATEFALKSIVPGSAGQPFTVKTDADLLHTSLRPSLARGLSYRVSYSDKFVMVSESEIYELDNAAHKPKQITTVPVTKQVWIDHSQSKGLIFIAGENASGQQTIFRVDLANNYAYTTYPAAGKYNFYEIEAFEDGTVYATALRNSDGKSVILKFAPDGTETLLDDTMNHRGVWLEKVTEFTNN